MKSSSLPARRGCAVFLDRDGTINYDSPSYVTRVDQVRLIPGAVQAVRRLNDRGLTVIVITNQAAIAHGLLTESGLEEIHHRLAQLLREEADAFFDGLYYCPFHPEGRVLPYRRPCPERKPEPGMLLRAARDHALDLSKCFLVGDRETDMIAARRAGCRSALVLTAPEPMVWTEWREGAPERVADDLGDAVEWILTQLSEPSQADR